MRTIRKAMDCIFHILSLLAYDARQEQLAWIACVKWSSQTSSRPNIFHFTDLNRRMGSRHNIQHRMNSILWVILQRRRLNRRQERLVAVVVVRQERQVRRQLQPPRIPKSLNSKENLCFNISYYKNKSWEFTSHNKNYFQNSKACIMLGILQRISQSHHSFKVLVKNHLQF